MYHLLLSILGNKKSIYVLIFGSLFLFVLLRIIPQFHIIYDFWLLNGVDISRKFEILYQYSFGRFSLWYLYDTIITILLTITMVINSIVFVAYVKRQKKILNKRSFLASSAGIFLGFFGIGCVSCGALVLAPLLSILGLLGFLEILPFAGKELVILGLFFVLLSTVYLLKKLHKPLVC